MEKLALTNVQNVLDAVKKGGRIGVFSINFQGKPEKYLSDIFCSFSSNFDKTLDIIEPAVRYIRVNYNKDIRLNQLAELCQISPSYLSRLFRQCTGKGIIEYVTEIRLEQTCQLLRNSDKSVVAIAMEVGYVDCGYLNKLFKGAYGCTPLEYRKKALY